MHDFGGYTRASPTGQLQPSGRVRQHWSHRPHARVRIHVGRQLPEGAGLHPRVRVQQQQVSPPGPLEGQIVAATESEILIRGYELYLGEVLCLDLRLLLHTEALAHTDHTLARLSLRLPT